MQNRKRSISIHTPARGVTTEHYILHSTTKFQSTLPQGEWRYARGKTDDEIRISIHTPARGVTNGQCARRRTERISIHTPARGVTAKWNGPARGLLFQSTLPQGEWHIPHSGIVSAGAFQSTLPQGEWLVWCEMSAIKVLNFNPHSRKGSDCGWTAWYLHFYHYFNPHSRKGSDTVPACQSASHCYFNPHSRKGSDVQQLLQFLSICISIHTPARGVTAIFTNNYISILSLSSKVTFQNHL